MGGVWERKNASLKRALEGTMSLLGPRKLTYDELATFVVSAEEIVNATPLWDVSADPNDPAPLSPSMILTLREVPPGAAPTEFTEQDIVSYGRKRWRRVQYLASAFWQRWHDMYIMNLTKRNKWHRFRKRVLIVTSSPLCFTRSTKFSHRSPLCMSAHLCLKGDLRCQMDLLADGCVYRGFRLNTNRHFSFIINEKN